MSQEEIGFYGNNNNYHMLCKNDSMNGALDWLRTMLRLLHNKSDHF